MPKECLDKTLKEIKSSQIYKDIPRSYRKSKLNKTDLCALVNSMKKSVKRAKSPKKAAKSPKKVTAKSPKKAVVAKSPKKKLAGKRQEIYIRLAKSYLVTQDFEQKGLWLNRTIKTDKDPDTWRSVWGPRNLKVNPLAGTHTLPVSKLDSTLDVKQGLATKKQILDNTYYYDLKKKKLVKG